jgi:two-component system, sensor histidine kinase LadS
MVKYLLIFFGISIQFNVIAGNNNYFKITSDTEYISIARSATILEDPDHQLTLIDVMGMNDQFQKIGLDVYNTGFTTSAFWVKFNLQFSGKDKEEFFLEVARPITNIVQLYYPDLDGNYHQLQSGDGDLFNLKNVNHRSSIFNLTLYDQITSTFYIRLVSDGEGITLPIRLYSKEKLRKKDYTDQFIQGLFYGILIFVFLIFLFFYIALKEITFLYYIIFVFSIAMLQFTLDGFSFQYLFPDYPFIANHSITFFASISMIAILLHARNYLQVKELCPGYNIFFRILIIIGLGQLMLSFTNGRIYAYSFPSVNISSLATTLLILFVLSHFIIKRIKLNLFYLAAYVFILAGAIIFILGNVGVIDTNYLTENGLKIGSGLQIIFLSFAMTTRYKILQQEKELAQAAALEKLEEMNRLKDNINIELEKQVKERTFEIHQQKEEIERKNKDITDSINYAKRIQRAYMPTDKLFFNIFKNAFLYYKPKDIVSGDFYWFYSPTPEINLLAVADCTGHGVPGALMSVICCNALNEAAVTHQIKSPGGILDYAREAVKKSLKSTDYSGQKDGMDISLCLIDYSNESAVSLQWAGANNPLWLIDNESKLTEIKGDKQPIGFHSNEHPFVNHTVTVKKGTTIYLMSDGFADQFGGPKGKKFKTSQLKEKLIAIHKKPMNLQLKNLSETFENWMGDLEQIDDVCVIGIKL